MTNDSNKNSKLQFGAVMESPRKEIDLNSALKTSYQSLKNNTIPLFYNILTSVNIKYKLFIHKLYFAIIF